MFLLHSGELSRTNRVRKALLLLLRLRRAFWDYARPEAR